MSPTTQIKMQWKLFMILSSTATMTTEPTPIINLKIDKYDS